jgi:hypothetical protein
MASNTQNAPPPPGTSDKPADAKKFAEATRVGAGEPAVPAIFEGAWKGLHFEKAFSGLSFTIDSNKVISNEFLVGGRNNVFSIASDDLVVEITSTSPRLVGKLRTKQSPVDVGSHKVSVDASFDTAVGQAGK